MEKICDENFCTGCCACYNICPTIAISMQEDEFGFMHPQIDNNICINCGVCVKVCPINHQPQLNKPIITYAAISKDENTRKASTSGGIATEISQYFISTNGYVFSSSFDDNMDLRHVEASNLKDLKKFQGSKYVQSFVGTTFKEIKDKLKTDKVLFIGTPCQVAGLINYIPKRLKDNLTTVSFICGGIPSMRFLKQYLQGVLDKRTVSKIDFRNGPEYGFWIKGENDTCHIPRNNPYFEGFDNHITLRSSCYNCHWTCKDRIGDITIGDFWGLKPKDFKADSSNGISIIICTTEKGIDLINSLGDRIYKEPHDIEETLDANPRLLSSVTFNKEAKKFRQKYAETHDFELSIFYAMRNIHRIRALKAIFKKSKVIRKLYTCLTGKQVH